jgi:predicted MFS family arabinose efflux permease
VQRNVGGTTSRTSRSSPGGAVLVATLGAALMVSGIQGIAPALPAIQAALELSAAEVSLLTSVYLFPSIFSAFPAGLLADRIGPRAVFAGSLLLFGACGLLLLVAHSFPVLLAVRAVQGAAFGVVLALSISVISDAAQSREAVTVGQSRRVIAMSAGEAVLPVAGAALVAVSWFAPFALQAAALPLGVAAWLLIPPLERKQPGNTRTGFVGGARQTLQVPGLYGVQLLGLLRFFFKFAVVTYFPLLAVNERDISIAVVGLALGASSLIGVATASLVPRLSRRLSPAQLIGLDLVVVAVSLTALAVSPSPAITIAAVLLFGLQDGIYAVAHNVLVVEVAPPDVKSSFVGLTGTVRNVGKFIAPLAFGGVTVLLTLSQTFVVFAAVAALSSGVGVRVHRVCKRESPRRADAASPRP